MSSDRGLRRLAGAAVVLCLLLAMATPLRAQQLVINIRAGNPAAEPRTVTLRSNLPAGVEADDILDLDGLELGYDIKDDLYYVHGEVELAPRSTLVKQVRIRDIWLLDEAEVAGYRERAQAVAAALGGTRFAGEAAERVREVADTVEAMLARQAANLITRVSPVQHIRAYEENRRAAESVRQTLGELENMALAAGVEFGDTLIGTDRMGGGARRDVSPPAAYRPARVRITVRNTSERHPRTIQVRREMPPEITVEDVIDPDGLNVRTEGGVTILYLHNLTLDPGETRVFDVEINDKWNVNMPRIAHLRDKIDRLRNVAGGPRAREAVANTIEQAHDTLEAVASESQPESLDAAYIAYFRRQSERLDRVEETLNRVEAAIRAIDTRRGFEMPAPDKRTTWLIIYTILGFLALMSLLFFLRWFGHREADTNNG